MLEVTLKSLHTYLRMLENPLELKRKMPGSSSQRTVPEGFAEICKLAGLDNAEFKKPQTIASVMGSPRFVMIGGEPSVTAHVARIFDGSRVLLTVLIDPGHFTTSSADSSGSNSGFAHQQNATKSLSASWAQSNDPIPGARAPSIPAQESTLLTLKPVLAGNTALTCRLFRMLFEHMLGFTPPAGLQQESATLVNELTGSKEHGRSFLASTLFILGGEFDRANLIPFLLEERLYGLHLFEHLLQNRDYCATYYAYRRLERAFMEPAVEEEKQVRISINRLNNQFGGKANDEMIFEAENSDESTVNAYRASIDLWEALALTPLSIVLSNSIAADSKNCVHSMQIIARHFASYAEGKKSKEQANQEIADHLQAFARQFSADSVPPSVP